MMKIRYACFLLLTLLAQTVLAKVSALDAFLEASKNATCNAIVSKMKLQDFVVPELSEKTKSLNQIQTGNIVFHYTNAQPVLKLLHSDVQDRAHAQTLINEQGGLTSMMSYSFKSKGDNYAGRGIYLAGNPFTSRMFGDYQVAFTLSDNTRTLQMNRDEFTALIKNVIEQKLGPSCLKYTVERELFFLEETQLIETIILQASGVDLLLYDDTSMWSMLVNEDVVQESKIIGGRGVNVLSTMLTQGRIIELTNSLYNYVQPSKASLREKPYNAINELRRSGEFGAFYEQLLSFSDEDQFKLFFETFMPVSSPEEQRMLYLVGHGVLTNSESSEEKFRKAARIVRLECGKTEDQSQFISFLKGYPGVGSIYMVDSEIIKQLSYMIPKSCNSIH